VTGKAGERRHSDRLAVTVRRVLKGSMQRVRDKTRPGRNKQKCLGSRQEKGGKRTKVWRGRRSHHFREKIQQTGEGGFELGRGDGSSKN